VATVAEAGEAVVELLQDLCRQPAVSYTDAESGETRITAYLATKPDWPPLHSRMMAGLARIRACGLRIGRAKASLQRIRRKDWAESWKRHFHPFEIGDALLVKPSWSRLRASKGQAVVVIDPGLSFGTGHHPTTAFCLQQLATRRRPGSRQSFLDIGTGSGILAIAAARLGYTPVKALDFDPEAVRTARANARRNRVLDRIQIRRGDVTKRSGWAGNKHDLICANLTSDLLISQRSRILSRLRAGGFVVLAGILRMEFAQVRRAYEESGLRFVAGGAKKEWHSGVFAFGGPRV
jgi:ribosomal protein L11 methyltransferase